MSNTVMNHLLQELNNYQISLNENTENFIKLGNEFKTPLQQITNDYANVSNSIRVGHLNAVSVAKHRDEIYRIMHGADMDVVLVSESNMKKDTPKSRLHMPGYKLFRRDRLHADRGGVAIYIKSCIAAKYIPLKYKELEPEMLCIEADINRTKVLIGVLYKAPKSKYWVFDNVLEELAFLTTKYDHNILMGDLNINQLQNNSAAYRYLHNSFLNPLQLTQLVTKPTRITDKTTTLLDLMMVTLPQNVKVSNVTDIPGISDHCFIYMAYNINRKKYKPQYITRRDFRNFSDENFRKDMETAPWGNIYAPDEHEVDKQVSILENIYTDIIEKHAPMRTIKVRKPIPTPWITDEIIEAMDQRDKYKCKFNRYRDLRIFETYKMLKNRVNYLVRRAKVKYFRERVNSKIKQAKAFHLALKDCLVVDSKKSFMEEMTLNPDKLNTCFTAYNNADVDINMIEEEITKITRTTCPFSLFLREVSELEVMKIVKSLKSNSAGIDGINTLFLKKSITYSIHALTEIINTSIKHSIFPSRWKAAIVIPIPKCDNPTSEKDFRPISLLCIFSKILEKVIAAQLIDYLINTGLFDKFQSAYRKYHSTTTALLHILDHIYKALDNNEITVLTLLDYSKAFDTANHKLIVAKLQSLGLKENALNWINSYLSNRTQKVKTSKGTSLEISLRNGVPQGSVLGPILFTILIGDLHMYLKNCEYHCYADDTQIFKSGKVSEINNLIRDMNEDLEAISNFSRVNCLRLNYDKNKYIIFASKHNLTRLNNMQLDELKIDGESIERKNVVKNLGVFMDESLSFENHIVKLIQRAYLKLKTSWKYSKFLSEESKIVIVESYVLSQYNYCNVIFRTASKTLWDRIQKTQNNCVRFIYNLRKYDHISSEFSKLNTLNMYNRSLLHALTYMFKCVSEKVPVYLSENIRYVRDTNPRITRAQDQLLGYAFNNRYGAETFFNRVGGIYNNFTKKVIIKPNCSIVTFKRKATQFLLSCQKNAIPHGLV